MVKNFINGETQVFGVIGDPISHTFSPQIQNSFAEGKNIAYLPFNVKKCGLEAAVKGAYALGIKGLNVTVPHKKDVMNYLCDIDKRAMQIGAVNTLKYCENGYIGYNTDYIGILYSLKSKSVEIKNKNVLLFGAGGSACAAAVMAASEGAKKLIIANRTKENAQKLKRHINKYYETEILVVDLNLKGFNEICDVAINTTTMGFGKNIGLSPINNLDDFKRLDIKACFDAVYAPWRTKFLKDAQSLGITAINGFDMLVYQAVAAQEIWFEKKYDEQIKENLRSELELYYKKYVGKE